MINLYRNKSNTEKFKQFRIQGKTDPEKWIEFTLDYQENKFECQKKIIRVMTDEWEKHFGYTFPSSLLNEFIRDGEFIEENE